MVENALALVLEKIMAEKVLESELEVQEQNDRL